MLLMIDNYDSFTYNLVQYLGELGADVHVHRNDAITLRRDRRVGALADRHFAGPVHAQRGGHLGAAHPALRRARCRSSASASATRRSARRSAGASSGRKRVMHGKLSPIAHDGSGVFAGLPVAVRRDALPFARDRARSLPAALEVTASADDGEIMGVRHRELAVEGVQFHPEAILTEHGKRLLANFIAGAGAIRAELRRASTARPMGARHGHDNILLPPRRSGSPISIREGEIAMTISLQDALQRTIEHREIFHDEMLSLMRQIMSGEVTPVMIAALTVGLRVKKETIGEIAAAAQVMREFATKVEVAGPRSTWSTSSAPAATPSHTFNISTAAMFVAAAAGARVAKHGNRSVSSNSGSADVLEALGANIMLKPAAGRAVASARPASASCSRRTTTAR